MANLDLWDRLWHARNHRANMVHVVWVKSHIQDANSTDFPLEHIVANNIADKLAESGAEKAQLPDYLVKGVLDQDRQVDLIQERILATSLAASEADKELELLEAAGRSKPRKSHGCRELERKGHEPICMLNCFSCKRCLVFCRAVNAELEVLLNGAECPGPKVHVRFTSKTSLPAVATTGAVKRRVTGKCRPPAWAGHADVGEAAGRLGLHTHLVHASHRLRSFRGVVWCTHCGRWATTTPRKLQMRCQPINRAGRDVISRIHRGLPPHTAMEWPVEGLPAELPRSFGLPLDLG